MLQSKTGEVKNEGTPEHPNRKLAHPTAYHLQQTQQMRFKEQASLGLEVMDNSHQLFFAQQQHQESSPNLSDIDYSELTTTSSVTGMPPSSTDLQPQPSTSSRSPLFRQHEQFLYDNEHGSFNPPVNVKRLSTGILEEGGDPMRYPYAPHYANPVMYYSSSSSIDQHYYYQPPPAFAGSAPANIGYSHMHHPSLVSTEGGGAAAAAMANISSPNKGSQQRFPAGDDVPEGYEDDFAAQANLQAIMEKRRRRRESHNAVERRRRDNINERIQELGTLLPESMTIEEGGVARLNKGTILRKSVEQIKMLQKDLREQEQRCRQLEETLFQLTQAKNNNSANTNNNRRSRQA